MGTPPLRPSVGPSLGPRNVGVVCRNGLRGSSLGGHETCEWCAEMSGADARGRRRWSLRWSYLWGHET
eukprot:8664733-Pyramimonas_sp.AAC.1